MENRSYINSIPIGRGWAWIVMIESVRYHFIIFIIFIAVMVTSLLEMGMVKSFGLFFVEFQKQFDASSSGASLPASLHGLTISLSGLGSSFIHGPSLSILGQYFHKRLGLANGICNCFGSFGAIIVPIIVNELFEQFGYLGAFLMLSSIFFQCTMCGAFMRPESYYFKIFADMKRITDGSRSLMDEVNSGHVSILSTQSAKDVSADISNQRGNKIFLTFSHILDFKTLKNPLVLLFMCVFSFGSIGCSGAVVFIPPYADERGMSRERIAELVTIYGVASCIGRFIVGIIADSKILQRYRIIMIAVFITGIILLFSGPCTEFWSLSVFTFLYGFFSGTLVTLFVPVCIDFLGPDNFKSAVGLLVSAQGVISAASFPVIGAMKDSLGSYVYGFYFMGVITILASPILFFVPLIQMSDKNKNEACDVDC